MKWWIGALVASFGVACVSVAQPHLDIRWMSGGAWREVSDIAFSPTDGTVAIASYTHISIMDFNTRRVVREIRSPQNRFFRRIAYSADGQWIAAVLDFQLALYRAADGALMWSRTLPSGEAVSITVSPNGEYIAIGTLGSSLVYLLRRTDGAIIRQWSHHTRTVGSVHFTPDGERVVSTGHDGEVCIWQVNSNTLLRRYSFGAAPYRRSALSPDGQTLALVGSDDNTARVIALNTGATIAVLPMPARTFSAAFTPDGRHLVVGVGLPNPGVHVWRTSDWTRLYPPYPDTETPRESVMVVAVSPDGQYWIEGAQNNLLPIRRIDTGARVNYLTPFRDEAAILQFSSDSGVLYAASSETGKLYQWNSFTGVSVAPEFQEQGGIASFAFDPTGRWLATSIREARVINLRDRATYALWLQLPAGTSWMPTGYVLGFSPNGTRLYAWPWARGAVAVWRVLSDGVVFERGINPRGYQSAYSPDGRYVATLEEDAISVWDAVSGTRLAVLESPPYFVGGLLYFVFSPDGATLVYAGISSTFYVWRWQENRRLEFTLPNWVRGIAFTPDGKALAVGDDDGILHFWRTDTWQPWLTINSTTDSLGIILFSSDGKHLALARLNGSVAVARNPFYPDWNNDGVVDDADLLTVLFHFGASGENVVGDVNYDGVVDDADLLAVLFQFGQ